jgi:crotonobetainyl-CoA:carnitine CoA-transferase CaiB-like acyl-CoA transferase
VNALDEVPDSTWFTNRHARHRLSPAALALGPNGDHAPAAMGPLVVDSGRGKLSAHLDLRDASARETLAALLRKTDIFVQGYRPGAIAKYGFSPQEAARIRPGIVCVSLCAYGQEGP